MNYKKSKGLNSQRSKFTGEKSYTSSIVKDKTGDGDDDDELSNASSEFHTMQNIRIGYLRTNKDEIKPDLNANHVHLGDVDNEFKNLFKATTKKISDMMGGADSAMGNYEARSEKWDWKHRSGEDILEEHPLRKFQEE